MGFKEWLELKESGTGTNSIAVYSLPIGAGEMVRRKPLDTIGFHGPEACKKKGKKALGCI
jgi:hypothetical protein